MTEFDRFTIVLLHLRPDAPELGEAEAAALQEAHMSHLADLHEAGYLVAAGPLADESLRGLSILTVGPEQALALKERDPAVQAGRFALQAIEWLVPAGAMSFSRTRFPRTIAEATGA